MNRISLIAAAVVVLALLAFVQSASAAVTLGDGGFEAGPANPYWSQSSTNGRTLISSGDARTGSYKVWLGGAGGTGEVSTIQQTFKMPKKGTVILLFWFRMPSYDATGSDKLQVLVDGNKLLTIKETNGASYGLYQQEMVDLSAYVDGGTHTLTIKGTDKSGNNTSWFIDDVYLVLQAIKNSGFENDNNADNVPDGWKINSPSGQTRRVCNEAYSGSCSVRLQGTGGAEQLIYVWKPGLTGKAGDNVYSFMCFKGNAVPLSGASVRVLAKNTSGVESQVYQVGTAIGTFGWTCGSISWTMPFDYTRLRLIVEYTAASGTLWVDDVGMSQQVGGPVP